MQKKIRKKTTKKKNDKIYFDLETEKAIIKFQNYKSAKKRKEIFVSKIKPSFDKLIENIIFTYKFHLIDDVEEMKNDCCSALFENINKYDKTKGSRAFSYFRSYV